MSIQPRDGVAATRSDRCNCAPGTASHQHHPATPAFAPPQPQQLQGLRREHGVAILASFALFDADQHACALDIIDLEVRDLRHAQARAIGDTERGLVLDARCCFEQPRRTSGSLRGWRMITGTRARSRRFSVTGNRNRNAETAPLMVADPTPFSC